MDIPGTPPFCMMSCAILSRKASPSSTFAGVTPGGVCACALPAETDHASDRRPRDNRAVEQASRVFMPILPLSSISRKRVISAHRPLGPDQLGDVARGGVSE